MAEEEHLRIARSGKDVWNVWKKNHPAEKADFSGTDFRTDENRDIVFSGFEFGDAANFSGAIFGDTPIGYMKHGVDPNRGSPNGAALFVGAVFGPGADFSDAQVGTGSRFEGAVFEGGSKFSGTVFADSAQFETAIFGAGSFYRARFGNHAIFRNCLFVEGASFEEAAFGASANFEWASFGRSEFKYSYFGHDPSFDNAVFSDLVWFDFSRFGDGCGFRGTSFHGKAGFDATEFGDFASFRTRDRKAFLDDAMERAKALPPKYQRPYLERAKAADPTGLPKVNFREVRFRSGDSLRYGREPVFKTIVRLPRRLFHRSPPVRRSHATGADFGERVLHGVADFSRARFEQPPSLADIRNPQSLDLAGVAFGFRASAWPWWKSWTTQTSTLTRLRSLKKIAGELQAGDAERDLFILERMAERGIVWSEWRDGIASPWDLHRLIRPGAEGSLSPRGRLKGPARLKGLASSAWAAVRNLGKPTILTLLVFSYRYLSNFGRSVVLPFGWLLASLVGYGYLYGRHSTAGLTSDSLEALTAFTLANAIPFVGASSRAADKSAKILFSGSDGLIPLLAISQGLVSAVLLFLIILALRNHFRVS